jgi:hypothetical protein
MDGSNSGYSYFASANFGDSSENKNSLIGEFTNSDDYISMSVCIDNLTSATLNLIEEEFVKRNNTIDNEEKTNLTNINTTFTNIKLKLIALGCAGHLQQVEAFLCPLESHSSFKKLKEISDQIKREDFNPYSNFIFRDLQVDISNNSFFKDEIGYEIDEFRNAVKKVAQKYSEAYIDLFETESIIKSKVCKFDDLAKQLNNILSLDINEASLELLTGLTKYLSVFFKDQKLIDYFNKFVETRKRFIVFRDILLIVKNTLKKTDINDSEFSLCSVCMNDGVSTAFIPCGHTFCTVCSNKTIHSCYFCRAKIQSKLKLYFC